MKSIWLEGNGVCVGLRWSGAELSEILLKREMPKQKPEEFVSPPMSIRKLANAVQEYLASGRPLQYSADLGKFTKFQKQVYVATCEIPPGETRTYGWIAKKIGNPRSVRAVGQALRRNRFPIVIPCHRVVSQSGIGGFMGVDGTQEKSSELNIKKALLQLERTLSR